MMLRIRCAAAILLIALVAPVDCVGGKLRKHLRHTTRLVDLDEDEAGNSAKSTDRKEDNEENEDSDDGDSEDSDDDDAELTSNDTAAVNSTMPSPVIKTVEEAIDDEKAVAAKQKKLMSQEKATEAWEKKLEEEDETDDDEDDDYDDTNTTSTVPIGVQSSVPSGDVLVNNVRATHSRLADNLKMQVDANLELKDLDDEKKSAAEIDASVQQVANETEAPLTAKFLGDMWKEMRQYSKPFYKESLQVKLAALSKQKIALEANVNNSQNALANWPIPS